MSPPTTRFARENVNNISFPHATRRLYSSSNNLLFWAFNLDLVLDLPVPIALNTLASTTSTLLVATLFTSC